MAIRDYKPILVFYISKRDRLTEELEKHIRLFAEIKGYEVLIWSGIPEEMERVEIISVTSSTIVENIQEFIDNLMKETNE